MRDLSEDEAKSPRGSRSIRLQTLTRRRIAAQPRISRYADLPRCQNALDGMHKDRYAT
jgi:hypothetical protein